MDAKNFPARLRQFREQRGMTQKTLAALMGVKQATVSKWELGDRETSHGELINLATILGCGLADLFSEPDVAHNRRRRGRPKKQLNSAQPSGGTDGKKRGKGKRGSGS
jgi:transcriptional regulator with XRE-family HTH domain